MATFTPVYSPNTITEIVNEDSFNLPKVTITGGKVGTTTASSYGFSGTYTASPADYPKPTFTPNPLSGTILNWSIDPSDVFKLDIYYLAKSDGIVLIHKWKQLPSDINIVTQPWKTNCDIEADPQTDPVFKPENNFNTITRVVPPKITTKTFIYTFDVWGKASISGATVTGNGTLVVTVTLKYDSSTLQVNLKSALERSLWADQYLAKHETQWPTRRKTDDGVSDPVTPDLPDGELLGHKPASEFMGVKVLNGTNLSKLKKSYYSEQTNQYGIAIKFKVPKDNIDHRKLVPGDVIWENFTLPDGYELSISSYAGDWSDSVNQMTLSQSARRSNDFGILMSAKPDAFTSELVWKKYKVTKGQEYYLNIRSGEPEFSTNILVVLDMVDAKADNNFVNTGTSAPTVTGSVATSGTFQSLGAANNNFNSMDPVRVLPATALSFDVTAGTLIQITTDKNGVTIPFTLPKNDAIEYWEIRGDQTASATSEFGIPAVAPQICTMAEWSLTTHAMGLGVAYRSVADLTTTGIALKSNKVGTTSTALAAALMIPGQKYYLNLREKSVGTGAGVKIKMCAYAKLKDVAAVPAGAIGLNTIVLPVVGNEVTPKLPHLFFDVSTAAGMAGTSVRFVMPASNPQNAGMSLKVDVTNIGAIITRVPAYYDGETYLSANTIPTDIIEQAKDWVDGALWVSISTVAGDFSDKIVVSGNHTQPVKVTAIETDTRWSGAIQNASPRTWKLTKGTTYYLNVKPAPGTTRNQIVTWGETMMNMYPTA